MAFRVGPPLNRPFTGGFSFQFKKIKTAIDFSRRFAIIILPSPGNGKPRQMRVDRGGTHGFQGRPPTTTGGFPLLREVTLLCYGAVKTSVSRVFRVGGENSPFLSFRARKHARSRVLDERERDFAKCRQLHLYIARMFEL